MRKYLVPIFLIGFWGCEEESEDENIQQPIVGTWAIHSVCLYEDCNDYESDCNDPGGYYTEMFLEWDLKYTFYQDGTGTATSIDEIPIDLQWTGTNPFLVNHNYYGESVERNFQLIDSLLVWTIDDVCQKISMFKITN